MSNTRLNLLDMQAAELAGMGPEWRPFKYEMVDGTSPGCLLDGAVAPIFVRGKRKGYRNWKKKDPATVRRIFISPGDRMTYEVNWSKETGLCSVCVGTGEVFQSWRKDEGTTYKSCKVCDGTGKSTLGPS